MAKRSPKKEQRRARELAAGLSVPFTVASSHRSGALAARKIARLQREYPDHQVRIISRRRKDGSFSRRGRTFVFEVVPTPQDGFSEKEILAAAEKQINLNPKKGSAEAEVDVEDQLIKITFRTPRYTRQLTGIVLGGSKTSQIRFSWQTKNKKK